MSFASPVFLWFFLPAVLLATWLLPLRRRNIVLVASSVLFYVWGGGGFVAILAVDIVVSYAAGIAIDRSLAAGATRRANAVTATAVAFALLLLAIWKYAGFAVTQLNVVLGPLGGTELAVPRLALPIGISFFTFHCISYVVDVRRRTKPPTRTFRDFVLYITLFPQLIAGPIVRYHEIADQLIAQERRRLEDFLEGFPRFALGLSKKVLIADAVAPLSDLAFASSGDSLTSTTAWLGAIAFTVQIYFDFSGYSDMAIGLARMFGFDFPENFARPYSASSITDFWRRWHMSLSRWFRDYVYIPLGGNRTSPRRTYQNLMAVFLLTGIWHGASWTFVLWGLYHGAWLLLERMTGLAGNDRDRPWRRASTLLIVVVGWVLFRAEDLTIAAEVLTAMFSPAGWSLPEDVARAITWQRALALAIGIGSVVLPPGVVAGRFVGAVGRGPALARAALVVAVPYAAILVAAGTFSPFLYFQF